MPEMHPEFARRLAFAREQPPAAPPAPQPRRVVRRKQSAIISGASIAPLQPRFERMVGMLLLMLSFSGSIIMVNGAPWPLSWRAILAGCAIQALCTAVQWIYRRQWRSVWLWMALAGDIGTSVAGYHAIAAPVLVSILSPLGGPTALLVCVALAAIAALIAILPETILID